MKLSKETKIFIAFIVIYFCFAWILTFTYLNTHINYVPDYWEWRHNTLLQADPPNGSNQFRVLAFWIPELVHRVFGGPIFASYLMVRFVFTFLTLCVFHLFLMKWFDHQKAFLSVVLLAAIMPITYMRVFQEADVIVLLFFIIGMWLVSYRKLIPLAILIFIGTFAKESIVFLIPLYFFVTWDKKQKTRVVIYCLFLSLVWLGAFYITREALYEGYNNKLWQLPHNIEQMATFFKYNLLLNSRFLYIPLFGIFWILPFIRLKEKPHFFRRAAPFIIVFTVIHFILGWPEETRIMLPLAFVVVPSGMLTLFSNKSSLEKAEE